MNKSLRRCVLVSACSMLLGVIIGIMASVHIFAIDVDPLALPHLNHGVKLTKSIKVTQGGHEIFLPQGTRVLKTRWLPGAIEYSLIIYDDLFGGNDVDLEAELLEKRPKTKKYYWKPSGKKEG